MKERNKNIATTLELTAAVLIILKAIDIATKDGNLEQAFWVALLSIIPIALVVNKNEDLEQI